MAQWRVFRDEYPDPDDVRMTLGEHLEELRSRLIKALVALFIGAVVCYVFSDYIMGFLCWPIFAILKNIGQEPDLGYFHPAENFMTFIKVSLIVGLILSAPYSITQIWGFVAAGLYSYERRWVNRFAPVSIVLFFVGAGFLLIVVSPLLLRFLLTYQSNLPDIGKYMPTFGLIPESEDKIEPSSIHDVVWPTTTTAEGEPTAGPGWPPILAFENDPKNPPEGVPWFNRSERAVHIAWGGEVYKWGHLSNIKRGNPLKPQIRVAEYVMFILQLSAAFGIGFQVPVVVAFLAAIGMASTDEMKKMRRYVWLGMAVGAAIITPPDLGSMLFLLGPMALLYEVGLIAGRFLEREHEANTG